MLSLSLFSQVWLVDFEFHQPEGHRPQPICMVARELHTGRILRVWYDDLGGMSTPPFPVSSDALLVAYYASAELGCFIALDWPMPARILDLFAEFRCLTNGLPIPCGNGLLGALIYHGLDGIAATDKDSMRALAQRGGPYTADEQRDLLDYCQSDVDALARLLPAMCDKIDVPRALLRGRYMAAAAKMEWNGTPVDTDTLEQSRLNWDQIKTRLIREIDKDYAVYVPTGRAINPDSAVGAEVLKTAEENGVDPYLLADAVKMVWAEERQAVREQQEALSAARMSTGLNARRISDWEQSDKDYSAWPNLDVRARELASQFPVLGIGVGYDQDAGYDATDYAGQLWDLLRDGARTVKPRHDPAILDEAVELLLQAGEAEYSGSLSFNVQRWAEWLARNDIPWPRLESGMLDLSRDSFRQMAKAYPEVAPIAELRHTISQLRLNDLAIGPDGRNRCLLSAFRARSSRNAPSSSKSVFGPSTWIRGLIQPKPGRAVAYVDWSQQEFGIAAALSGDDAMREAYSSGDPYLTFAKQARAVPVDATKETHRRERELFKTCALGVQYGMGARSLAFRIGEPEIVARNLLALHRETYSRFWKWSQAAVDHAMLHGWIQTVFGWRIHVGQDVNPRSLLNFPMQGNGADMLRLACCLVTEHGVMACMPVHDALLIEADEADIETTVDDTRALMAEASRIVLDGFQLRTDAEIVYWPDRFMDKRGVKMWDTVMGILNGLDTSEWCDSEAHVFESRRHMF
jgi:hypothetical protein